MSISIKTSYLFLLFLLFKLVSPYTKATFIEKETFIPVPRYRRLYSFDNNPFLFTNQGVFELSLEENVTDIEPSNSFSSLFNLQQTASNVIQLQNGNYAIGCLNNNKLLEFDKKGKILHNVEFLELDSNTLPCNIALYGESKVFISFVNTNLYGKIIIYDINTHNFEHVQTNEQWVNKYTATFDCKFFHLVNNIMCVFSPNDYFVYYATYSTFGQHSYTRKLIDDELDKNIDNVYYLILSDVDYNENVYGDIIVSYKSDNKIILHYIRFEIDLIKRINVSMKESRTLSTSDPLNYTYKLTENIFVIVIGNSQVLLFTKELKMLGSLNEHNFIKSSQSFIMNFYAGSTMNMLLEYSFTNNYNTVKYLTMVKLNTCKSFFEFESILFSYYDIFVSKMVDFDNNPELDPNKIKAIILSLPESPSELSGWYINSDTGDEEELFDLTENDYTHTFIRFSFTSMKAGSYVFTYYLAEEIEDDFYISSVPCEVHFSVKGAFNLQPCIKETSIVANRTEDSVKCVPIESQLVLQLDDNENRYYSMYLDFSIETFNYYFDQVLMILNRFISQRAENENKNYNDTIVNINGVNFSFYYLPANATSFRISNSSFVKFNEICEQKLISQYELNSDENFYIAQYDIYQEGISNPNIEYDIYSSNGTLINMSICKDDFVSISYSLSFLSIDSFLETGGYYSQLNQIDIFNLKSDFYNDICYPFNSLTTKDTTLTVRRKEFYPNKTLCENNCTYVGVDFNTKIVECQCRIKTEIEFNRTNHYKEINSFEGYKSKTNIEMVKCTSLFFTKLFEKENCGFYIIFILLILQICLILFYLVVGIPKVKKHISKISNFTTPIAVSHFFEKQISSVNSIAFQKMNMSHSNSQIGLNDSTYFSFNKFSNNFKSTNSKNTFDNTTYKTDNSPTNRQPTPGDLYFKMYWKLILVHHPVISILYKKNKFTRNTFKYIYSFTYIFLSFSITSLFVTDSLITSNYYSKENVHHLGYILKNNFLKAVYSFLICFLLNRIFFYFIYAFNKLEHMRKKITNKDILLTEMTKAHFKLFLFFIINSLLMIFFLYYCSVFCVVYPNTQTIWIAMSGIVLVLGFFSPFVLVSLLALIRLIGKMYDIKGMKSFVKKVNNY